MMNARCHRLLRFAPLLLLAAGLLGGCASQREVTRNIEVTGYCDCGECNGYYRGSPALLHLNFWDKYIDYGSRKGQKYTGRTANGGKLRAPQPGLVSLDSLARPWMIPFRLVLPWKWLPRKGSIAADTDHYPFGTEMHIPGWGWGVVADRGGAIKGPERLDLFFTSHGKALDWGRKRVDVTIVYPDS